VIGVAGPAPTTLGEEDHRQAHPLDQLEHPVLLEVPDGALGTGENGVVVGEHRDGIPIHSRSPGDEAVGRSVGDEIGVAAARALLGDGVAAVLDPRSLVDQVGDVLARRPPAAVVALGDHLGSSSVLRELSPALELGEVVPVRRGIHVLLPRHRAAGSTAN
jgi:hypothetical protein